MDDDPELRQIVITESKYMDLFWKFFEFLDKLKDEIRVLPKIRTTAQE